MATVDFSALNTANIISFTPGTDPEISKMHRAETVSHSTDKSIWSNTSILMINELFLSFYEKNIKQSQVIAFWSLLLLPFVPMQIKCLVKDRTFEDCVSGTFQKVETNK